jgi:hypothetical protein
VACILVQRQTMFDPERCNQRRHESASSLCPTDVDIPSSRSAERQSAERKRRPGCRTATPA